MGHLAFITGAVSVLILSTAAAETRPLEPKTEAAVLAADQAWGDAENRGDGDFVDWLLMPNYQSISPAGKATSKAAIVAGARKRASAPTPSDKIAAWKAAHPLRGSVSLFGDTAVLTWISTKIGAAEPVSSCDIFVYRDGHWHAIYSQHSEASL